MKPASSREGEEIVPQPRMETVNESDLELAREAIAGSQEARKQFAERMKCVPKILTVMNGRMGAGLSSADLEDLSQEALVAIWRRLSDYNGQAALTTWVYRFCHFTLLSHFRRIAQRPKNEEYEDRPGPLEEHSTLKYDHVYRALDLLPPEDAMVVRLKHFSSLTFDEIGVKMEMPPSTVKANYYRIVERLREILARDEFEVA